MIRIQEIKSIIERFIQHYFQKTEADAKFLTRSLQVKDAFAYFYLLAKVHKTPWKTRPIVSVCGSILHGLGQWVDAQLQKVCKHLPYIIKSSSSLVQDLRQLDKLPVTTKLFSMDAVSMYTNIDTSHALRVIAEFLRSSRICTLEKIKTETLIGALDIIMHNNLFKFGDTYWVQLKGTAMGAPPAPMYATLYYNIYEQQLIPRFPEIIFYGRYINDSLIIWDTSTTNNTEKLQQFQKQCSEFGSLTWESTNLQTKLDFLDITISVQAGKVHTTLYEKAINLYLYLPPHSAHSPSILKGLITGTLYRIAWLCSNPNDIPTACANLFQRLTRCGYSEKILRPIFDTCLFEQFKKQERSQEKTSTVDETLFLHLPYHPDDPKSSMIQKLFKTKMLQPTQEPHLCTIRN
jgi:hypothetical protein